MKVVHVRTSRNVLLFLTTRHLNSMSSDLVNYYVSWLNMSRIICVTRYKDNVKFYVSVAYVSFFEYEIVKKHLKIV